jgi:hypothetical protein
MGADYVGRLPLSLLALSHQPDVTHSNYTCAMLASPAHHAPRLDASRRTPGALHPEPEFSVLGHFADGLLFYLPNHQKHRLASRGAEGYMGSVHFYLVATQGGDERRVRERHEHRGRGL